MSELIKATRGDCTRCHIHKPGVKVFLLQSNPSISFGNLTGVAVTAAKNYTVCKECLTDEEIAKMLAPIAKFVIETLYLKVPAERRVPEIGRVHALLSFLIGVDRPNNGREQALKALE